MNKFQMRSDNWPKGEDPVIRKALVQRGVRLFINLTGAAAGLYIGFTAPHGMLYMGPFLGMAGIYQLWSHVRATARAAKATEYEIFRYPPEDDSTRH